jgi:hypothetical protein
MQSASLRPSSGVLSVFGCSLCYATRLLRTCGQVFQAAEVLNSHLVLATKRASDFFSKISRTVGALEQIVYGTAQKSRFGKRTKSVTCSCASIIWLKTYPLFLNRPT